MRNVRRVRSDKDKPHKKHKTHKERKDKGKKRQKVFLTVAKKEKNRVLRINSQTIRSELTPCSGRSLDI